MLPLLTFLTAMDGMDSALTSGTTLMEILPFRSRMPNTGTLLKAPLPRFQEVVPAVHDYAGPYRIHRLQRGGIVYLELLGHPPRAYLQGE